MIQLSPFKLIYLLILYARRSIFLFIAIYHQNIRLFAWNRFAIIISFLINVKTEPIFGLAKADFDLLYFILFLRNISPQQMKAWTIFRSTEIYWQQERTVSVKWHPILSTFLLLFLPLISVLCLYQSTSIHINFMEASVCWIAYRLEAYTNV